MLISKRHLSYWCSGRGIEEIYLQWSGLHITLWSLETENVCFWACKMSARQAKWPKKNQNFLEQIQVHSTLDIISMWREGVSNSHTCYAFYWWQLLLKKPKDSSFSSGTWTEFSRVRHDNRAHWQPKWVQWSHYSTFIAEKHDCDTSHLTRFTFSWMSFFVSL